MLRQMHYFQAVVRNQSFSKAAEACFISQSAISQQVQALEKEIGATLLRREGRKFPLTPEGEVFYQKSLAITAAWEELSLEIRRIQGEEKASLRLGCLRSYGGSEFRQAVQAFGEGHPGVELHLTTGNHEELYQLLVSQQVDLVLSDQRRTFAEGYYNQVLAARPYQAELVARHPIAQREAVSIEDFRDFPCILVSSSQQWDTERAYYRDIIGLQGEFLHVGSLEEGRLLAVSGKGFLLLEGSDGEAPGIGLKRIPLYSNGKPLLHNYCAFWSRENSGYYVEEFALLLEKQFPQALTP